MVVSTQALFDRFDNWYAEARAHNSIPYANAMSLATVSAEGKPSVRIVLLKARDDKGFVFYTNKNSRKSQQIRANDHVALCFYWGETGKQIRIEGTAVPTTDAESDAYFETRPRESQLGAWASHQSEAIESRQVLKDRFAEITKQYEGQDVPRPPHWGGWRVLPEYIEFWEEGAHRLHKRYAYSHAGDGWTEEILCP